MPHDLRVGDRVTWSSHGVRVRGKVQKKVTCEMTFKGNTVRASEEEPQYLVKSDQTERTAMHKGSALRRIRKTRRASK
jgi:uncharacterized protein YndB with AHSA1/START domain